MCIKKTSKYIYLMLIKIFFESVMRYLDNNE